MILRLTILCWLSLAAFSCGNERSQAEVEQAIQERLDKKLTDFSGTFQARCRKDLLSEATRVADSILLTEAKLWTDTIARPALPHKPVPPAAIEVSDSVLVAPFLERDSL